MFRSVAKSAAASEHGIRGQPLGDSAVARFALVNIRLSTGELKDRTLVLTQNSVLPHITSTIMGGYVHGVERGFIIRGIRDHEIGQAGDADGWGLWGRGSGVRVHLRGGK